MVGGTSKKNLGINMGWLWNHPKESMVLLKALTRAVAEYTLDQVWNIMHVVQIFDAMGMMIKDDDDNDGEGLNIFEE